MRRENPRGRDSTLISDAWTTATVSRTTGFRGEHPYDGKILKTFENLGERQLETALAKPMVPG
jgi:hypothetical protein